MSCYTTKSCLNPSRAIHSTGCISNMIPRRLPMNSGEERSRLLRILRILRIFGSDCYILRDKENLEKFDVKSDKGFFLGYSSTSRAYKVYNMRT